MANLESAVEVARVQTAWGATLYFDNFLKEKTKLVRGRRVPQRNGSGILRVMGHQTCGGGEGALISDFAEFLISCKKFLVHRGEAALGGGPTQDASMP